MNRSIMLVGLTFSLLLAGCAQPPAAPARTISALVDGPVESAYLDPLKPTLQLVQYDGSQKPENYDLLILDGDHHTPAALKDNTLVQSALRAGRWVLALDVTSEHKRDGLGETLHAASQGTSLAYAVHLGQDARGRPEVQVVESPGPGEVERRQSRPGITNVPGGVPSAQQGTDPSSTSTFAGALLDRLTTPVQAQSQALPSKIPDDLIYATYRFATVRSWTVGQPGGATQHPNYTANYAFTVFLNDTDNTQGQFQYVLLDADVTASPRNATEDFAAARVHTDANWTDYYDEWGWFQTSWNLDVTPSPLPDPRARLLIGDTSPDTVNSGTTVTSGVSFTIGYNQAQGGNASFGFSESTSRNITDWKVTNQSAGNVAKWYYRTQYPLDNDIDWLDCYHQQIYSAGCYIRMDPNALSINTLSFRSQAYWQTADSDGTPKAVDAWQKFAVYSKHGMLDLYCKSDFGAVCGDAEWNQDARSETPTYSIDLGAVLPIPIRSLTFSPDPARAGTAVVGTVTLSQPARLDTEIKLSSNSQNATVLPKVVVKQGQTSATFQVLTSANGVAPGGSTVATITAFHSKGFQKQLTIQN